jgi:hypothetical protein
MRDQLDAHEREVAAVKAVTTMLLARSWEAVRRARLLLSWFNRDPG